MMIFSAGFLPPRHLKTFLASVCLLAWLLAHIEHEPNPVFRGLG
jgi:hypothetical protein